MIGILEPLWTTIRVVWYRNFARLGTQQPLGWVHILLMLVQSFTGANRLWLSKQYMEAKGAEKGLQFAERHVPSRARAGISLLRASASGRDDERWLHNVNKYLAHYDTAPIDLAPGDAARFLRLRSGDCPPGSDVGDLISVIMPAFNSVETIEHSIKSVLSQTWRNLELIVVDDCSSDNTCLIVQELARKDARIKCLRNTVNVGPYVSKNLALRVSSGAYITGQDADDWAHPRRLEADMRVLLAEKAKAIVSQMVRMNADGNVEVFALKHPLQRDRDGIMKPAPISFLIDAYVMKSQLGGWDSVRFNGDTELISRASKVIDGGLHTSTHCGLLCLDRKESLSNDPIFGISKSDGPSQVRAQYRRSFSEWHRLMSPQDGKLSFPLRERPFPAPMSMRVPVADVMKNLGAHINGEQPST